MISGHLSNQKSKHFTSENRVAMRRCLRGYVPRIIDDIDDACYDSRKGGLGAVDDVFDRYLLSCVR